MRTNEFNRHLIFFVILALTFAFGGVKIGSILYDFEPLAKGVLGSTILYLLWRFYVNPKPSSNKPLSLDFKFPRDIMYVGYSFFAAIIGYLSIVYVGEAVLYLLSLSGGH